MKISHRLMEMVFAVGVLLGGKVVMQQGAHGQSAVTNSHGFSQGSSNNVVKPFKNLSEASLNSIFAAKAGKPKCVLSFVTSDSQENIFGIVEPGTVEQGLSRYIDGYCGFGARLCRDYVGEGSLVTVAFHWDQSPKTTVISFYGTNAVKAETWRTNLIQVLEKKYGAGSVEVNGGLGTNRVTKAKD